VEPTNNTRLDQAFEHYYEKYRHSVFKRVRWLLSRYNVYIKEQAEDLFQTIFFSAFRWMKTYMEETGGIPPEEVFVKVLHKIETAKYINCIKKGLRVTEAERHVDDFAADDEDDSAEDDQLISSVQNRAAEDPEKELMWTELVAQLDKCLKKLAPHESTAISCKVLGNSDREIAAMIGKDEKKVTHSTLPLARLKLTKCLEAYLNGTGKQRTPFSRSRSYS
jgi:RNA polymerase sigma factor (sigma-70 family)